VDNPCFRIADQAKFQTITIRSLLQGKAVEMFMEWKRLLDIVMRTSFKAEKEPIFPLASKRMSNYYVDCKQALSDPEARKLIGKLMSERTKMHQFDAVGGLELGAYPIATSVSDAIYETTERKVRAFAIRKERKSHGVGNLIAGNAGIGDHVLIVDDVVTTGSSTIAAIKGAREAGMVVDHVIVLVDREEDNGKRNIEDCGVTCDHLFTLENLKKAKADATTADENSYPAGAFQAKSA
jgi:orotate phosphoribosyltransferase